MNYRVICIDAKNRPSNIPIENWIEEGETYTVIDAANMAKQGMVLGVKLSEISLPPTSEFEYYLADRFRPVSEEDLEAEEAVRQLIEESFMEELLVVEEEEILFN